MGTTECNLSIILMMYYRHSTGLEARSIVGVINTDIESLIEEYMNRESTKDLLKSADITYLGIA